MTFNFNKKCVQCVTMTIKRCAKCPAPLCGSCKTKKPRGFPGTETYLPVGVCKSCLINWNYKMNELGYDIAKKISNKISNKFKDFINK